MNDHSENIDHIVIETIKSIALTPKSLDILLDTFAKQASLSGAKTLDENSKLELKSLFLTEDFLKPFVEQFKMIFSNDELCDLLKIYQSNAMKKWMNVGQNLFGPLYSAMNKKVAEMTKT